MRKIYFLQTIALICLFLLTPALAQEEIPEPDAFDIYDISSGSFLDEDINNLYYAAREAYVDGDYELSAQYYLTYLQYDRANDTAIYNLACCYGLLGEAELAGHYLTLAVQAGFMNRELIDTDTDFDSVRGTDEFDEALETTNARFDEIFTETQCVFLPCEAYAPCHIQYPDDYVAGESRTLVVALHANRGFAYGFSNIYGQFDNPDFIYAAIQAPYAMILGDYQMYTWDWWGSWPQFHGELPSNATGMSAGYIENSIRTLKNELNADRVFLLGFNDGAAFGYRAGLPSPDLVDGIISFEGPLDSGFITDAAFVNGTDVRIFIVHNLARDEYASEILQGYGYDVTLYDYEGEPCEETNVYGEIQEWMAAG